MKPEDFTCQWFWHKNDTHIYEQPSLEYVIEHFKGQTNLTMLDIGAHVGYWSLQMSPYFESIHAFECNPDILPFLALNTYNYENITVHPHGVDLKLEQKNFVYLTEHVHGMIGSYVLDHTDDEFLSKEHGVKNEHKRINVTVAPPKVQGPVHFIKIDVEGAEFNVLKACHKYKQYDPLLHIEIHREEHRKYYSEEYITVLHSLDESNHIAKYK